MNQCLFIQLSSNHINRILMKKIIAISIALLYGGALLSQSFDDLKKMVPYEGFFDFYYDSVSDKIKQNWSFDSY